MTMASETRLAIRALAPAAQVEVLAPRAERAASVRIPLLAITLARGPVEVEEFIGRNLLALALAITLVEISLSAVEVTLVPALTSTLIALRALGVLLAAAVPAAAAAPAVADGHRAHLAAKLLHGRLKLLDNTGLGEKNAPKESPSERSRGEGTNDLPSKDHQSDMPESAGQ